MAIDLPTLPIKPGVLTFRVPWADRLAVAERIMGLADPCRPGRPMSHPLDPATFASEIMITLVSGPRPDAGTAVIDVTFREPDLGH